ncbi:MAG: hypothetical protein IJ165_07090 [Proteobacteria bacterium]|nr:hypothetical protein [Pseudomonadota bacterium]
MRRHISAGSTGNCDKSLRGDGGGKLQSGKCSCNGEICENANWCDSHGMCSTEVELTPDLLCVASGGSAVGGACECSGKVCEDGVVCNLSTKKCPETGEGNVPGTNPGTLEVTFELACKASGGEAAGGICVCNGVGCERGIICNFNTKNCADKGIQAGDACTGNVSECHNNDELVGQVMACNGSSFEVSECKDAMGSPVSCNHNKCGTCKNYTQICENQLNAERKEIGHVMECQEGVPGKTIAICQDVSCRTDIPACGECVNGELKCSEDNNANAIMFRCVNGKWERLRNKYDPIDPDYSCKPECRISASLADRNVKCFNELEAHPEYCDGCDPCAGVGGFEFRAYDWEFNPCYDEEKCAALKKAEPEDPDYPPFRMPVNPATYEVTEDCQAKGADCPAKRITGYNYLKGDKKVLQDTFDFDLTNHTFHVSCNADKTRFGQCHNSLQTCINEKYHQNGYIIQCVNGTLSDYDGNSDGIACKCVNEKSEGACCYTRANCFKNSTAVSGLEVCQKPKKADDEFEAL